MKKILSIDGGGIRGIVPARILAHIERLTGRDAYALFDLIAGTSTGGILGCAITQPKHYTATAVAEMYHRRGPEIFSRPRHEKIWNRHGAWKPRYTADGLSRVLKDTFGDTMMMQARTDLLVTSYEVVRGQPKVFCSWDLADGEMLMSNVALATSAAPTYFPLYGPWIDGGVWSNNPVMVALAEAQCRWPGEQYFVLSLGTGYRPELRDPKKLSRAGAVGWAKSIFELLMDGPQKGEDYQARRTVSTNLIRIQEPIQFANPAMDLATEKNCYLLSEFAEWVIRARERDLELAASRLKES